MSDSSHFAFTDAPTLEERSHLDEEARLAIEQWERTTWVIEQAALRSYRERIIDMAEFCRRAVAFVDHPRTMRLVSKTVRDRTLALAIRGALAAVRAEVDWEGESRGAKGKGGFIERESLRMLQAVEEHEGLLPTRPTEHNLTACHRVAEVWDVWGISVKPSWVYAIYRASRPPRR